MYRALRLISPWNDVHNILTKFPYLPMQMHDRQKLLVLAM